MAQRGTEPNPELAALAGECDDIRVKISLLLDDERRDPEAIPNLLSELARLEACISKLGRVR